MKVVGCARREDKLTNLSTALNGQTGKVELKCLKSHLSERLFKVLPAEMWPGQWIRHQVNVLLDQFPSWTWKGTVRRDRLLSRKKNLNNIYIRSMFASTMRVLAPRRHSGMAPWSLGELCWMSMYSVGNIIICCRAYSKHHISSLSVHPAERGFHGLQQDWWWANHHDRVNVRTQGPSKPFNEANYRHI